MTRLRVWLFALLGLAAGLAPTGAALAHALLLRSTPAPNAMLARAPASIELWFSEPLEPALSGARLLAEGLQEVPTSGAIFDPADPSHIVVPISALEPGFYTVAWKTLSRADGHEARGSFPFTVLRNDGLLPDGQPANPESRPLDALPDLAQVIARWMSLLGGVLLVGAPVFGGFTLGKSESNALAPTRLWLVCASVGALGLAVGGAAQLGLQVARLSDGALWPQLVFGTRLGALTLARIALAAAALGMGALAASRGSFRMIGPVGLVAGLAALLTFSAGSHASANALPLGPMLSDFAHLLAAGVWLGGLLALAAWLLAGRRRKTDMDPNETWTVLGRFSGVATASVAILLATGIANSLIRIETPSDWLDSAYGRVLLAKIALVAAMLGVAWFNRILTRRGPDPRSAQRARRQVLAEAALGLAVMIATATLTQTQPPLSASARETRDSLSVFEGFASVDDLQVHALVSPNRVGVNQFTVHLSHNDGTPLGDVQRVRLTFDRPAGSPGPSSADMTAQSPGSWSLQAANLNQSGAWTMSIYVRRRGLDDATAVLTMNVP